MPNVRTLQRSFSGGEVTPQFYGRIDDVKYQTGLAMCRNFIVLPHGPVQNRAGTAFVRETKNSAAKSRLIPFTYSTTQTFAIELGAGYFRYHTQGASLLYTTPAAYNGATAYAIGDLLSSGGVNYYVIAPTTGNAPPNATYYYAEPSSPNLYEVPNPYAAADLFDIHYVQSSDVMTLVHPNYVPMELRRQGATNWTLIPISFASSLNAPTGVTAVAGVVTGAGRAGSVYKVTAVDSSGIEESLPSGYPTGTPINISAFTNASPGVGTTSTAHGLAVGNRVLIQNVLGMTQINQIWQVNTVPTSTTFTLVDAAGAALNTTTYGTYTSGGTITSVPEAAYNNLLTSGNYNTITWAAVSGALRYNVYKQSNGLFGFIGQTDQLTFKDDNITADISQTPPLQYLPFVGAGNYPGAVSYFEQRRCFAGTLNKPQNMWMTRVGTESNLSNSIPTNDSDAINFRVFAREANTIRHIIPLTSLLLLTSSAEWRVTSVNSDAITPTSISVSPQAYVGASNVQPIIVNNNVLYIAARGGHMRELAFTPGSNGSLSGYTTGDVSLRAPHLFDNYDIVDLAYSKAPYSLVWAVRNDGTLIGLTYVPEQEVGAFHHHDTDGQFESVCCVAEGREDILYVIVNRTINGAQKRYVERMSTRQFANLQSSFFVDCGFTFNGAATTITGLGALEGKKLNILVDGGVHPQRTVTGGSITLDYASTSVVQLGLPITADIQLLPLSFQTEAFGQGRTKNVNKVWLRVDQSSGIFAGPSFSSLKPVKQRTNEPYGAPPALKTQEVDIDIDPTWSDSGTVCIRQSDPLPLTIVDLVLEVSVGA